MKVAHDHGTSAVDRKVSTHPSLGTAFLFVAWLDDICLRLYVTLAIIPESVPTVIVPNSCRPKVDFDALTTSTYTVQKS